MTNFKITFTKRALVALFVVISSNFLFAQSDCEREVTNSKAKRYYEKSKNHKLEDRDRIEAGKAAVTADENCMPCRMQLAKLLFLRAKYSRISYEPAAKQYKEIIERCPEFHSDAYYYLGLIAYGKENLEDAIYYFNQYLNFDSEDPKAFAKDYDKKIADIEDILPELEFYKVFKSDSVSFNPQKVKGVCTKADEYLPMITADQSQLFYTRKLDKKAKGDLFSKMVEELTVSVFDEEAKQFNSGFALPKPFNLGDNYGGLSVTPNGREIYLTVCKPDMEGYNNCDIYNAHYYRYLDEEENVFRYKWSELKSLGNNINQNDTWEAQPSISADGRTLYYATFRYDDDKMDIYVAYKNAEGKWTKGQRIKGIDTEGNEKSPFIHPDGKTMFYASDNQLGAGGYDLYMSRLKEDGKWTKPRNLGVPINTREDEHGLIVSTDGTKAYFSSSRISGSEGLDIYEFTLPVPVRPKKMSVIKGNLKGLWPKDYEGAKVELKNLTKQMYFEAQVDTSDGAFVAVVEADVANDMVLTVTKENYAFQSKLIDQQEISDGLVENIELEISKLEPGKSYRINDIKYATNSADIKQESKLVLSEFALYLKDNSQLTISILGHTDNVGNSIDNLALSQKRANAVKLFLQELGIKNNRISSNGFGETKPVDTNDTEEGRANNRRTEFKIVKK